MYGERDDPYRVLSQLGQRLEATLAPNAVLPVIVQTVTEALKLPYAAITLKQDDGFTIAASAGSPVADPLALPLLYQNEPVGQLLLSPRGSGETFSPTDRRLLDDLARQAGIAAHAVRLTTDLQRERERLVTAREEERRRIRRDLHDGLGPALAGLNLQAGQLRRLIPRDPNAADALLVELQAEIRAAVADIRRLVNDLRPPTLDELGLVGAIRARAAQYDQAGDPGDATLHVLVDAPEPLPPLPAAVEVAVYRIVQEALTNVVRHAQAHTCVIRLALADGLRLAIADDGVGLPVKYSAGMGLRSMRERAVELGGTCTIGTAPEGGTQVLIHLPLV
jgi:signal transduction histidine kinase